MQIKVTRCKMSKYLDTEPCELVHFTLRLRAEREILVNIGHQEEAHNLGLIACLQRRRLMGILSYLECGLAY